MILHFIERETSEINNGQNWWMHALLQTHSLGVAIQFHHNGIHFRKSEWKKGCFAEKLSVSEASVKLATTIHAQLDDRTKQHMPQNCEKEEAKKTRREQFLWTGQSDEGNFAGRVCSWFPI